MTDAQKQNRILIIDDEPDTVAYLETLLQDNGYVTLSAGDGEEGMVKMKAEHPDLVLLDMSMPQKSGMRFYREMKADSELMRIPVIVVTGVTGHGGDKQALKRFMDTRKSIPAPDGFVPKPIDRNALLKKVEELLR